MSVTGKKAYKLYLDPNNTEFVKSFIGSKRNQGGLSALLDNYIAKKAVEMNMSNDSIVDNRRLKQNHQNG